MVVLGVVVVHTFCLYSLFSCGSSWVVEIWGFRFDFEFLGGMKGEMLFGLALQVLFAMGDVEMQLYCCKLA